MSRSGSRGHSGVVSPSRPAARAVGLVAAWVAAATAAVVVGVLAVSGLGASFRDRGPIGDNEAVREAQLGAAAPTRLEEPGERRVFSGAHGRFVVRCRGAYAEGLRATPAPGWRVVSYEPGPDDDVDAIFTRGRSSVEIDVFCNRGMPTIAELERNEIPAG